jgi:hypothetical protein
MINATVARENVEAFVLAKKERIVKATHEWLDTTVSREIEKRSKSGGKALIIWYKDGVDKTLATDTLIDCGYKVEERVNGALSIEW